ncbi:hypothetical protein Patl1_04516 [Pistacia atlantica]|uniref:Uncharacterized protein n=1 Tax=Pistacia atlantica TaxID=434234 RepID=A0ACC1BRH9_9ROSI|nr:hypothetical protein Patl1_04516 [Pistacia atlantica]
MNSKTTTKLITRNNKNNYETNRKFLLCCTKPPGTPLVAMNMNMNKDGSVRSVWGCADELKEPVFKYAAVGGEYESDDAEILKDGKRKKKKGGGKKLLRIFKAILFETSMAKKLKKRKLIKKQKQASKGATLQAEPGKIGIIQ